MKRAQVAAGKKGARDERDLGARCKRTMCRMGDREGRSEIPMTKQDESPYKGATQKRGERRVWREDHAGGRE